MAAPVVSLPALPAVQVRVDVTSSAFMIPNQGLALLLHLPRDQCGHRETLRRV